MYLMVVDISSLICRIPGAWTEIGRASCRPAFRRQGSSLTSYLSCQLLGLVPLALFLRERGKLMVAARPEIVLVNCWTEFAHLGPTTPKTRARRAEFAANLNCWTATPEIQNSMNSVQKIGRKDAASGRSASKLVI